MSISDRIQHEHSPEQIKARLSQGPRQSYLRDWVYGGVDGAVTTFAIVTGAVGADLTSRTVLILGIANLIADGFSMSAGNYLATKAEQEEYGHIEAYERQQIEREPKGEKEEVRQILTTKGFSGQALEHAIGLFTADPEKWTKLMMSEEYGLPPSTRSPKKAALSTFSAFVVCGAVPLIPFLLNFYNSSYWAVLGTSLTFFAIGSLKSRWSVRPWWKSGFETLAIGLCAAICAFLIGSTLHNL